MVPLAETTHGIAWYKADTMAKAVAVYGGRPQSLMDTPAGAPASTGSPQPSPALNEMFKKYGIPQ